MLLLSKNWGKCNNPSNCISEVLSSKRIAGCIAMTISLYLKLYAYCETGVGVQKASAV